MRMLRVLAVVILVCGWQPAAFAALADDAAAYFVATSGSDANAGNMAAPFQTIQFAVNSAQASATRKRVIVSKGTYDENVTIPDGVSLYGGFDAAAGWSRAQANTTTIAPSVWVNGSYPVYVLNATATVVDGFTIIGPDAPAGSGQNAVAVRLSASVGTRIRFNEIFAGRGGSGNDAPAQSIIPSAGITGGDGMAGCQGAACGTGAAGPGAGAPPSCSTNFVGGSNGGTGGFGNGNGNTGGGNGGFGGNSSRVCGRRSSNGNSGLVGQLGSGGFPGTGGGTNDFSFGPFDSSGWQPRAGLTGAAGSNGLGGPGGGGGGGGSIDFGTGCIADWGGGGGGGGSGGCGSLGGLGAGGGGASIAILSGLGDHDFVDHNLIHGGFGGNGGAGGASPLGGVGGSGGIGGTGFDDSGSGGNGGKGGDGGRGGGGGGGAGGHSTGVLVTSGRFHDSNTYFPAPGGAGGAGGDPTPGGSRGKDGTWIQAFWNGSFDNSTMRQLSVAKDGTGSGTVTSDIGWIDCGATCSQTYEAFGGTTVTLTAIPDSAHLTVFTGWTGACGGTGSCVVNMSIAGGDKAVTATFVKVTWPLTVSLAGSGLGSVDSSPAGIACDADCQLDFDDATIVTLTPAPGAHSVFAGWSGACTGTGACNVTMNAAKSVTATFAHVDYALDVSKSGAGIVSSTPAGISCGATCTAPFEALTVVTLAATPDAHWAFTGWSGACTGTGACVVTMDGAKSVGATFVPITFTITAAKAGTGAGVGSVSSAPAGIDCGATCAAVFAEATAVVLTATAGANSTFVGWSGCDSVAANQCTLAATSDRTATATFTAHIIYNVVLEGAQEAPVYVATPAAGGGTATYDPVAHTLKLNLAYSGLTGAEIGANIRGPAARGAIGSEIFTLAAGSPKTQTFTLMPDQEAQLLLGQLYVNVLTSTQPTGEIRGQIDSLGAAPKGTLTIAKAGTGTGSVLGNTEIGIVIDCGSDCTEVIPDSKLVTLFAAANAGSSFAGWTNCPAPSGSLCTFPMAGNRAITASFAVPVTYPITLEGYQVSPYVYATAGGGGIATYDPGAHQVYIDLQVFGLAGFTGAHLHGPAARGANAPMLVDIPFFPITVPLTPQQEAMLLAGQLYIDIHTSARPNGELRGQLDNLGAVTVHTLGVTRLGSGAGTVIGVADGTQAINCGATCSGPVPHGKVVTFTVTAAAGATFAGWGGACSGTGACEVTMDQDRAVTASFTVGTNTLTVVKLGAGTGTVTSTPAGIDCGAACSASFGNVAPVTLVPTQAAGSVFVGWGGACIGKASCVVTVNAAKTVTATFALDTPRLGNISTRMQVGTGGDVLIAGFIIEGVATKRVAIVATGPSLTQYGITNALEDPVLKLVRSSDQAVIATNDDYDPDDAVLRASGFAPGDALESAMAIDLAPGAYTAIVSGYDDTRGVAVVAVYEVDHPEFPLINISTRGQVLTGNDVMIGGFIIQGDAPQTLAIVATGPSLAQYGITNPLANPTLTLVRSSDQAVLATNDDWQTAANAAALQAAGFAPSNPLESAILVTLPPGAYTAILSGAGGGTGVGIVGVYALD